VTPVLQSTMGCHYNKHMMCSISNRDIPVGQVKDNEDAY